MFNSNLLTNCFGCWLIVFSLPDENGTVSTTITESPIPLKDYIKFCEQRRKFPVLYKLEFQVSFMKFVCRRLFANCVFWNRWRLKSNNIRADMPQRKPTWRRTRTKNAFLVSISNVFAVNKPRNMYIVVRM